MREVLLPSGATLKVTPAPFADSNNLYKALLKELKAISIDSKMEMSALYKDLFCIGFSSEVVEKCIWECLKRCTYNEIRITMDTFEPISARDDYMSVCTEVVKDNVGPFLKSLFAEYKAISELIEKNLQS